MLFNPDPSRSAREICLCHKWDNENYSLLVYNDTEVQHAFFKKHLGLINKIIGIIKKLSLILSRKSLLKI